MAILDWESFARETADLNIFSNNNWVISADNSGPFGYGRFASATAGTMQRLSWYPTVNEKWWQAHIWFDAVPSNLPLRIHAMLGSGEQCEVRFDTSGVVQVWRGSALLGASTKPYPVNGWFFCQIRFNCLTSAGAVEVWINGSQYVSVNGNTANQNANGSNGWKISYISPSVCRVTNVLVYSTTGAAPNSRTPETRIYDTLPTGAGGATQWTPSAGANWQCVNEQPSNGDTTYVSAASAPLTDTYSCPAEATAGSIIYAVAVHATARKDDAGTNEVDGVLRSAGANYANGAPASLSASYARYRWLWNTDPATGTAWTVTGANAAQPGIRRTS
jgi:hypothetical protein